MPSTNNINLTLYFTTFFFALLFSGSGKDRALGMISTGSTSWVFTQVLNFLYFFFLSLYLFFCGLTISCWIQIVSVNSLVLFQMLQSVPLFVFVFFKCLTYLHIMFVVLSTFFFLYLMVQVLMWRYVEVHYVPFLCWENREFCPSFCGYLMFIESSSLLPCNEHYLLTADSL